MIKPWWEMWPGRLEWELEQLRSAGIPYEIVEKNDRTGTLRLSLSLSLGEEQFALRIVFPCFFPFTRVEVYAPDLRLRWHQNPYLANLCLLGQSTDKWDTDISLARYLIQQMPKLLAAVRTDSREDAQALEEIQAEPITALLPYTSDSTVVILDDASIPQNVKRGRMDLLVAPPKGITEGTLRAAVAAVYGKDDELLSQTSVNLSEIGFPRAFPCRWYRSSFAPAGQSPREFLQQLSADHPSLQIPKFSDLYGNRCELIGIRIPEEADWRKLDESWLFILRREIRFGKPKRTRVSEFFIRASRASRRGMQARIPELSGLIAKKIAVVGLGCMGAPSVLEFARAGIGELRLMDSDFVEPETTVRWPLGLTVAGLSKASALAAFVLANYPYTRVKSIRTRLGAVEGLGGVSLEESRTFFEGADLIYDATAEQGIHYLLSSMAKEMEVPYVGLDTTWGGWGGRLWAFRQKKQVGCWYCLRKAIQDGRIPTPPEAPNGYISIPGCAEPTFTGASFDTSMIPMMGVRTAVSILCEGTSDGYPSFDWDMAIVKLRNGEGKPILPEWKEFELPVDPECPNHSN